MKSNGLPIRIDPIRGRLPWKYSIHRPRVRLQPVFWWMVVGVCFWGGVYLIATHFSV